MLQSGVSVSTFNILAQRAVRMRRNASAANCQSVASFLRLMPCAKGYYDSYFEGKSPSNLPRRVPPGITPILNFYAAGCATEILHENI
jgi:hypothetical protein